MPAQVILLKEPRGTAADDPYHIALTAAGLLPRFLPVLDHVLVNQSELVHRLARATSRAVAALIITSQRAVEAYDAALRLLDAKDANSWTGVPIFVVGPATAAALSDTAYPPLHVLGADESGTGDTLAAYIVEHYRGHPPTNPLLYLVGDKRREVLPSILRSNALQFEELEVYRTDVRADFEAEFAELLDVLNLGVRPWLVFFSPSGAKVALPVLRERGLEGKVRLAAIGPTTRDYLADELGVRVDAMAATPSAAHLVATLQST